MRRICSGVSLNQLPVCFLLLVSFSPVRRDFVFNLIMLNNNNYVKTDRASYVVTTDSLNMSAPSFKSNVQLLPSQGEKLQISQVEGHASRQLGHLLCAVTIHGPLTQ